MSTIPTLKPSNRSLLVHMVLLYGLAEVPWNISSPILLKDRSGTAGLVRLWKEPCGFCTLAHRRKIWELLDGHRRFHDWVRSGVAEQLLLAIDQNINDRGDLVLCDNLTQVFMRCLLRSACEQMGGVNYGLETTKAMSSLAPASSF